MEAIDAVGPCWVWTKSVHRNGYGKIWDRKKHTHVLLHRFVWEQRYGPAGKNMVIHHRCGERRCYNPDHLQRMSKFAHQFIENIVVRTNIEKTHCKHGHEFTLDNTYTTRQGTRGCRECIRKWSRDRWRRLHSVSSRPL